MKREIIIHAEGDERLEAEGKAMTLTEFEWGTTAHQVDRINSACGRTGIWHSIVFSSSEEPS